MATGCTSWRIFSYALSTVTFFVLLGLAINSLVRINEHYHQNSVFTWPQMRQNDSITLPDFAICVPLSFLTTDPKLTLAAKHTLLHDPSFLSKAFGLDEDSEASKRYREKMQNIRDSGSTQDLLESFINKTLKPFLKNVTFPEESQLDKVLADEEEVFDILEISTGALINKTILLASVAVVDVMTGLGKGRDSASSLLLGWETGVSPEETSYLMSLVNSMLDKPEIANEFSSSVARTLCQIFAPQWADTGLDLCAPKGPLVQNSFYISLNKFCFNIPVSSTTFTKSTPSHDMTLSLPLAQTVFSFEPLGKLLNGTLTNMSTGGFPLNASAFGLQNGEIKNEHDFSNMFNFSLGDDVNITDNPQLADISSIPASSVFGFNLPPLFKQYQNLPLQLNLSEVKDRLDGTNEAQAKMQQQLQSLLQTDLMSLAFKFPIVLPRQVSFYFPNDMRFYETDGVDAAKPKQAVAGATVGESLPTKVLTYVIEPTDLVSPSGTADFSLTEVVQRSKCAQEVSTSSCMTKCHLENIRTTCDCTPFGTHLLTGNANTTQRFCKMEDQQCIIEADLNFQLGEGNITSASCQTKCFDVCSTAKYKWRQASPKTYAPLGSDLTALTTGQPTFWKWTLTCDTFDYMDYAEHVLITDEQYISQVGGILGFYGTIFGLLLLVLFVLDKLLSLCSESSANKYEDEKKNGLYPHIENGTVPAVSNSDLRKAIEDAVAAVLEKKNQEDSTKLKGGYVSRISLDL